MNNMRNPRKGFSIVEVIIALAIITLVSAVVVSLVMSSNHIENNSMSVMTATNVTENVIECFRFAESKEEFDSLLEKLDVEYEYNLNSDNLDRYVIKDSNYKVIFVINYVADEIEINTIVDGEEIYNCIYTRE